MIRFRGRDRQAGEAAVPVSARVFSEEPHPGFAASADAECLYVLIRICCRVQDGVPYRTACSCQIPNGERTGLTRAISRFSK